MMRTKTILSSVLLVMALFLLSSMVMNGLPLSDVTLAQEEQIQEPTYQHQPHALLSGLMGDPYAIADIAEMASPAIVYISVEWPSRADGEVYDPFRDFFDSWFFSPFPSPRTPSPRQPPMSQGTGFIIDPSGIIVTNQHVVGNLGDEQTITVTVNSPNLSGDFEAELLGADAKLDLAVLQILSDDDEVFPCVALGDSDLSRPGEWVIAIGNPYGKQFEHTVTVGVLSAKGREIRIRTDSGTTQVYSNLMQTDAAINRGNSGGPLLNIKGEVIGINTAVHAQAQGIGFAIPINVAKDVLDELIETGGVEHILPPRAWLGVWYNQLTDDIADHLGIPDRRGILIADVMDGSPADEAGLQPLDVVRRVDNNTIATEQDFAQSIVEKEPGDTILLTVVRDGKTIMITATLGNMPAGVR